MKQNSAVSAGVKVFAERGNSTASSSPLNEKAVNWAEILSPVFHDKVSIFRFDADLPFPAGSNFIFPYRDH